MSIMATDVYGYLPTPWKRLVRAVAELRAAQDVAPEEVPAAIEKVNAAAAAIERQVEDEINNRAA